MFVDIVIGFERQRIHRFNPQRLHEVFRLGVVIKLPRAPSSG